MALLIIAFLLYLTGVLGVFLEGTGEFWLWFLAAGLVLNVTIWLLSWLGADKLRFIRTSPILSKATHMAGLLLAGLAAYHRLLANISVFTSLLVIILILWIYTTYNLFQSWRKESSHE